MVRLLAIFKKLKGCGLSKEKKKITNKWTAIGLLFLVVPASLVAIFALSRILPQSLILENITTETVTWEIERPSTTVGIYQVSENSYRNNEASVNLSVYVDYYVEEMMDYGDDDVLSINVSIAARVEQGFVQSVNITFHNDTQPSQVEWFGWSKWSNPYNWARLENLTLVDYEHWKPSGENVKATARMEGANHANNVYFNAPAHWIFRTQNDKSHQIMIASEITYHNGTAYKKVVLPMLLKVIADAGNTLETARTIGFGNHTAHIHLIDDPEDYYKVWFDEGQTIRILLSIPEPGRGLYLDLYLYDPNGNLTANSCSRKPNNIEQITYTINQSGYWFIRVLNPYAAETLYTLSIMAEQP